MSGFAFLAILLFGVAFCNAQPQCGPLAGNATCFSRLGYAACCSSSGYCGTTEEYCAPGTCASECPSKPAFCGDLLCNGDETCSSCSQDCGPCTSVSDPIYTTCTGTSKYALTFDDGPTPGVTDKLLDILKAEQVQATFFVVGERINRPGGAQLVQRAIAEGHLVLPHTFSHSNLTQLSKKDIRHQMFWTEAAYRRATCGRPLHWMRPPYGEVGGAVRETMAELGYRMVTWTIDSRDYDIISANGTTDDIIKNVKPMIDAWALKSAIHLQHDLHIESVNSVQQIIQYVKSKGYQLVRLDDCILGPVDSRSDSTNKENVPWIYYLARDGHGCLDHLQNRNGGYTCSSNDQCGDGVCESNYCKCNWQSTCDRCSNLLANMTYSDICPEFVGATRTDNTLPPPSTTPDNNNGTTSSNTSSGGSSSGNTNSTGGDPNNNSTNNGGTGNNSGSNNGQSNGSGNGDNNNQSNNTNPDTKPDHSTPDNVVASSAPMSVTLSLSVVAIAACVTLLVGDFS